MSSFGLEIFKAKEEYGIKEILERIEKSIEEKGIECKKGEKSIQQGNDVFNLKFYFANSNKEGRKLYWYEQMKGIFDNLADFERPVSSSYGVLVIEGQIYKLESNEVDRTIIYIITFGLGIHLVSNCVDLNFGLEFASRAANEESINTQSSKFFSLSKSKSLTIYNSTNFSTQVGEAVDYLIADLEERNGRKAVTQLLELIDSKADFSSYLRVSLKKEVNGENIISIIKNIDTIMKTYKPNFPIPKLYYLQKTKDAKTIEKLNEKLSQEVLGVDNTSVSIGIYINKDGKIETINDQDGCEIYCGRLKKVYGELNLENVKEFIEEFNIHDIGKIKVRLGLIQYGLYDLIDYTTCLDNENEYYCLSNGRWTRFNKEYVKKVEKDIKDRISPITVFDEKYNLGDLQELRKKYSVEITGKVYKDCDEMNSILYQERVYNCSLRDDKGFMLLDRKEESTIEVADLYAPKEKALMHVKIGEPGKFIECINQSINGARHYVHNKGAVIKKFGKELKNVEKITLVLIITNKTVWKKQEISKYNSLRLKLNLLDWINAVQELGFKPEIIIGKKKSNKIENV